MNHFYIIMFYRITFFSYVAEISFHNMEPNHLIIVAFILRFMTILNNYCKIT